MTKPNLVISVGDYHSGSTTALAIPFVLADGQTITPSRYQVWLKTKHDEFVARCKQEAQGHFVTLLIGGDMIDGVAHHGTSQTVGTTADQRDMAVELTRPLWGMADRLYALRGTDAHVGSNGEEDSTVAGAVGAQAGHYWQLDIGGRLIDWAHHCKLGQREWTIDNPLITLAETVEFSALRRKRRVPDLVLRHHVHRGRHVRASGGMQVVTCPCWQLPTSWLRALDPRAWPDIGGVLYHPADNRAEVLRYELPDDPIVRIDETHRINQGAVRGGPRPRASRPPRKTG